jgi:hypothetical protein
MRSAGDCADSRPSCALTSCEARSARLIESYTDPISSATNNRAGQTQSIARHNERESFRDIGLTGHLQSSSGNRQVADDAIDGDAVELNPSGFHDTMASSDPCFDQNADPQKGLRRLKLPCENYGESGVTKLCVLRHLTHS